GDGGDRHLPRRGPGRAVVVGHREGDGVGAGGGVGVGRLGPRGGGAVPERPAVRDDRAVRVARPAAVDGDGETRRRRRERGRRGEVRGLAPGTRRVVRGDVGGREGPLVDRHL